jgi:hypothetical protein
MRHLDELEHGQQWHAAFPCYLMEGTAGILLILLTLAMRLQRGCSLSSLVKNDTAEVGMIAAPAVSNSADEARSSRLHRARASRDCGGHLGALVSEMARRRLGWSRDEDFPQASHGGSTAES